MPRGGRSFTRAAAKIGISQSALSHTIRHLEARLGVRLLARTTRAVSPTEAGDRLVNGAGLVQDNGLTGIVTERLDAGVRMSEQLAKDMISVRISPDFRFAVVGTKSYFKNDPEPLHPRDLVRHTCINDRLPTCGGFWPWEFREKDGLEINIRVDGQLAFDNVFKSSRRHLMASTSPTCRRILRTAHRRGTPHPRPRKTVALLGWVLPLLSQRTSNPGRPHPMEPDPYPGTG